MIAAPWKDGIAAYLMKSTETIPPLSNGSQKKFPNFFRCSDEGFQNCELVSPITVTVHSEYNFVTIDQPAMGTESPKKWSQNFLVQMKDFAHTLRESLRQPTFQGVEPAIKLPKGNNKTLILSRGREMDDLTKQPDLIPVFSIFGRESSRRSQQKVFWLEMNKTIVPLNPKNSKKQPMALKKNRKEEMKEKRRKESIEEFNDFKYEISF